jgi:Papain-like cysteine protease AvrRpt2
MPSFRLKNPAIAAQVLALLSVPIFADMLVTPSLNPVTQQGNNVCWAASDLMVSIFFNKPITTQCGIANAVLQASSCCVGGVVASSCDVPHVPDLEKVGFSPPKTSPQLLDWASRVQPQLNANRPYVFTWNWTGTGQHYLVATGWGLLNGTKVVYRNDPMGNNGYAYVTYLRYAGTSILGNTSDHSLGTTFYDLK